jgi:ATP-binding cassette, subfamily B, bacterial
VNGCRRFCLELKPLARRVPFIPQIEAVECGAASLAMVLASWGHHAPLSEVREVCGISRDGSRATNILGAARKYGLVARGYKTEPAHLASCKGPAILHWGMNHFVVLEQWTPEEVHIVDPGEGRRIVTPAEFDERFTGVCLEMEPGDAFAKRARPPSSARRYLKMIRGAGSTLAIVLFASLALNVLATVLPLATQLVLDQVIARKRVDWLSIIGASAAGLVTFAAFFEIARGWVMLRLRARLDVSITRQFVAHLLDLPVPFYAQRSVADLMARVQANRTIRELFTGQSVSLLADGTMLLVYLGLMFAFDARLSGVVLAGAAFSLLVFVLTRKKLRLGADEAQRKTVSATTELLQTLKGIATIKSAGVERTSHRRWLNAWIASINSTARVSMDQQRVASLLVAIQLLVPVALLWFGGRRVLDGELTPGRLVAFQMLQAGFLGPLLGIVQTLLSLQIVPVLLARMDDVLEAKTEPSGPGKASRLEGEIVLENVSFRYAPTSPDVLDGISLRIAKGQKVALVGSSGSGKSTLARLLLGLYGPTKGRILVDGTDLTELDASSVRRQYGVVLQETSLFDGTVADNLRLFYPNAPLEHLVLAARVAQIHDDIMALPRGYETPIGSGSALSGGQRQRLALARAIVHRPPIMLFDEATSALDAVTEAAIERYLSTRACTRIIIAHRLSTVRDADAIIVLDGGRIAEQGRHDELIALGGVYARLASAANTKTSPTAPILLQEREWVDLGPFALFADWPAEETNRLADELERCELEANTRIVEQDARGAGLYLIVDGTVAVELSEPGLPVWTVAELGAGAVFGEIGLLDGSPSSASVVARSGVRLLHLSSTKFQALQARSDALAARAMLSLGGLVAERSADAIRRHTEVARKSETSEDALLGAADAEPNAKRGLALPLGETLLAATLREDEVDLLTRLGTQIEIASGEVLYRHGTPADAVYVLLAGNVEMRAGGEGAAFTIAPGGIVAEAAAFGASTHAMTAVARGDVVALAFGRDTLVDLLLSGRDVAQKLLGPLAETLVRRFRLANFRLREAVALEKGELDRAHVAHDQSLVAAREEREALLVPGAGDHVPLVRVEKAEQTSAACLVALLRAGGRPISLASVVEAFAARPDGHLVELPHVARALGLRCRVLDVPLDDLRSARGYGGSSLLGVMGDDERVVVLERRPLDRWRVMDPLDGERDVLHDELASQFTSLAFELRPNSAEEATASLPRRIALFARSHASDLARLVAVSLLVQGLAIVLSLATASVVHRVFPFADRPLFGVVVAAAIAMGLTTAFMDQVQGRAIEHLRAHFDRELLDQLMNHLLKLPISFFDRYPPGEVLQRLQAFENVRLLFSTQGVAAILSVAQIAASGALLLGLTSRLASIALVVAMIYAVATWLLFTVTRRAATEETAARGRQQDRLLEILGGIVTLRMAGDRAAPVQRWLPSFLGELSASLRQDRVRAIAIPLLGWTRGMALVLAVWLGARDVVSGGLSLGGLVAVLGVLGAFLHAIHALAAQIIGSAPSVVDYGLVRETFIEKREQVAGTLVAPGQLRGKLGVENVSFRYTPDGPNVLRDVSLEIESGSKIALVGASGSGKSTLGRLLLGLYLPTAGRILFDGKDVKTLDLGALRRRMGVVLQDPFLITGSVRDNIALGGDGIAQERVIEAAEKAAIHEDIERMPMSYSTRVSEGGTTFSGGQRQRVVIARALLTTPAVMLLDEATSALDNVTQAVIEANLSKSSATRIVIAHRLSTIVDADRIIVLQKGKIVEEGRHDDLVAKRGAYFDLIQAELAD